MINGYEIDIEYEREVEKSCESNGKIIIKETSKQFEKGLKKMGITMEDFNINWWYMGGNNTEATADYANLWIQKLPASVEFPKESLECICGQWIFYNSYATNGKRIIVVGTCCKNRFLARNQKSCSRCGKSHKNRKDNFCKECRVLNEEEKQSESLLKWLNSLKSPTLKIQEQKVSLPITTFQCKTCKKQAPIRNGSSYTNCYPCYMKLKNSLPTYTCGKCFKEYPIYNGRTYKVCFKCK